MPILPIGTSTKQSGFTLVELIIVVTLLALFSAISLPLLLDRGDGDSRRVMRRIAGTVKQLYNEATLTRDEHQLVFDLDSNSMTAFRLVGSDNMVEKQQRGREIELAPLRIKQIDVAGKGSFRIGRVPVSLYPLGWMEQTRIVLVDEQNVAKVLDLSPLTGSTKINDERRTL